MPSKVLVVDDSTMVRAQVGHALGRAGFEIREAIDGLEALATIREGGVDLVVCDINMPRMTGLELLAELGPEMVAKLPVVMLTTEGQPTLVQRAKALGAKGWIIKPFKPELLVSVARKLIRVEASLVSA
jgi:two-component system, chemotaxis family, chemotaxis protein CheY